MKECFIRVDYIGHEMTHVLAFYQHIHFGNFEVVSVISSTRVVVIFILGLLNNF